MNIHVTATFWGSTILRLLLVVCGVKVTIRDLERWNATVIEYHSFLYYMDYNNYHIIFHEYTTSLSSEISTWVGESQLQFQIWTYICRWTIFWGIQSIRLIESRISVKVPAKTAKAWKYEKKFHTIPYLKISVSIQFRFDTILPYYALTWSDCDATMMAFFKEIYRNYSNCESTQNACLRHVVSYLFFIFRWRILWIRHFFLS